MILRPPLGHFLDRRLMLQKVAAVDGVVEVQPLVVALLAREVVDAVDAALGADAVRALDRHEAHQVDVDAQLGQLHGGRQPGQSAADDHHSLLCHSLLNSEPHGAAKNVMLRWPWGRSRELAQRRCAILHSLPRGDGVLVDMIPLSARS